MDLELEEEEMQILQAEELVIPLLLVPLKVNPEEVQRQLVIQVVVVEVVLWLLVEKVQVDHNLLKLVEMEEMVEDFQHLL